MLTQIGTENCVVSPIKYEMSGRQLRDRKHIDYKALHLGRSAALRADAITLLSEIKAIDQVEELIKNGIDITVGMTGSGSEATKKTVSAKEKEADSEHENINKEDTGNDLDGQKDNPPTEEEPLNHIR